LLTRRTAYLPNRFRAPLTPDEVMAEEHAGRLGRLIEIAEVTGNRSLRAVALGLQIEARSARRRRTGR
jgi:hypothetical protein